jgi:hypothetical protein
MFKTDRNMLVLHHPFCPDVKEFKQKPIEEKTAPLKKQQKAVAKRKEKVESGRLF